MSGRGEISFGLFSPERIGSGGWFTETLSAHSREICPKYIMKIYFISYCKNSIISWVPAVEEEGFKL